MIEKNFAGPTTGYLFLRQSEHYSSVPVSFSRPEERRVFVFLCVFWQQTGAGKAHLNRGHELEWTHMFSVRFFPCPSPVMPHSACVSHTDLSLNRTLKLLCRIFLGKAIYCLHEYLNIYIPHKYWKYWVLKLCPLLLQERPDLTGHIGDMKEDLKQRSLLKVPEVAVLCGLIASGKRSKCMEEALKITLI